MVRMNSANIAYQRGRIDLFRQYSQDAITVAEDKKLEYLELVTRIRRYENLLIQDRTGHTLDELQKERLRTADLHDDDHQERGFRAVRRGAEAEKRGGDPQRAGRGGSTDSPVGSLLQADQGYR